MAAATSPERTSTVGRRKKAGPVRARSLVGVLGLTALGLALPGSSFLMLRRRLLGAVVLLGFVCSAAVLAYLLLERRRDVLQLLVQTGWLIAVMVALGVGFLAWTAVIVASDALARPRGLTTRQRFGASAFTLLVCSALAVPFAVAVSYASAQRDFIRDVFAPSTSATRPEASADDPWLGRDRVNVLLLGGDVGSRSLGTRTDSIMVASIDVDSGDTVLFGLPRNLENVPFPPGTPLAELYPQGFTGPGDPLQWMANAIYSRVPQLHPGVLGKSDNEGADALKLGVSGALGIPVDYYLLVSIPGFVELIDAMGGVTVNVNQPIPIGGVEGVREPEGYLQPGPDQLLDGFEALWFARGRYGLDDYDRMRRQRCLVDAVIDRADPGTLLTRYEQILDAGRQILRTDIPADLLPAFVDLTFQVKDAKVRSVVFARSERFAPESPDYAWMQNLVARATGELPRTGGGGGGNNKPDTASTVCTYQPAA